MKDSAFVNWLADRLVCVYGEPDNVDFVLKAREISKKLGKMEERAVCQPSTQENIVLGGYHFAPIPKGKIGEISKIEEEFLELKDSAEQGNKIMQLNELSDLIGAIELYAEKLGMTLDDLVKMKDATKRAFQTGHRQ